VGQAPARRSSNRPQPSRPFGLHLRNGSPVYALVQVYNGAHVRISGIEVRGPLPCGLVTGVIAHGGATLEFTDATVSDMFPTATDCAGPTAGRAVAFGLPPFIDVDGVQGSNAFGRVSHVTVDGYLTEGMTAIGARPNGLTNVTFADNVVRGETPNVPTEQFGINAIFGAVARITGNTIVGAVCTLDGCGGDPILEFQSVGIEAGFASSGTRIRDNYITGADVGIYQLFSPDCCGIADNSLADNRFFGIIIQDGDGSTDSNIITSGQTGIGVVADAANTTGVLHGDIITGMSLAPVRELQCCGFTATAIVGP
jgi:hypothetical protein